jgi:hypothetical protein
MAGVSLRSRVLAYLRFPGAIRALVFQTVGQRPRMATKKEEARRAVLIEYDGCAKKTPRRRQHDGRLFILPILTARKVGDGGAALGEEQARA